MVNKKSAKAHWPQVLMLCSTALGLATGSVSSVLVNADTATPTATQSSNSSSSSSSSTSSTSSSQASDSSSSSTQSTSISAVNGANHHLTISLVNTHDGNLVASDNFIGQAGTTVDLTKFLPQGYKFANASDQQTTIGDHDNTINVPVTKLPVEDAVTTTNTKSIHHQTATKHHIDKANHKKQAKDNSKAKNKSKKATTKSNKVKKTKHQTKVNHSVPDPKALRTPMPTNHRKFDIHNPMLRPDGNSDQISNAKNFKSEVPFRNGDEIKNMNKVKLYKDFDKSVLRWKPYLDKVTKHYHMKKYTDLFLAIMENETHGTKADLMQSSESTGLKPNTLGPHQSIEQAVRYMKSIVKKAKAMDKAEQRNPKVHKNQYHYYATDNRLLAQTYAFGGGFLDYISKQKDGYTLAAAQRYSKDVIAPKLGNANGETYHYDNPISRMYHKEYLYKNGGNYFYGDLVSQYMVNGFMHKIMEKLINYVGQPYVWGGKDPQSGFDCSGLVSYGLKQVGVNLPSYTVTQFQDTKPVKSVADIKPGDLVFFKGTYGSPNFISHVAFIIDRHTMFGSDSSGVGFHNLDESYWKHHFAGIRRVKQSKQLNHQAHQAFQAQVRHAIKTDPVK